MYAYILIIMGMLEEKHNITLQKVPFWAKLFAEEEKSPYVGPQVKAHMNGIKQNITKDSQQFFQSIRGLVCMNRSLKLKVAIS